MDARSLTVEQIAVAIDADIDGDKGTVIHGVASIESAGANDLTFAIDDRRIRQLADCNAGAVLVAPTTEVPDRLTALRVSDIEAALATVLGMLAPPEDLPDVGVHPTAQVHPTVTLGEDVAIGPNTVVGADVTLGDRVVLGANVTIAARSTLGDDSVLHPGVVIRHDCRIGRRCRLHSNAVIGTDGFGYYHRDGVHHRIPHAGAVVIGDDVDIGSCACVDRAKFGETVIGDGSKIDNLVQIGHNVQFGRGVLAAGMVGVAGSAKIGNYVVLGGHVGIRDNISIGDGARIAAYSAVAQDVAPGEVMSGILAIPMSKHLRAMRVYAKLPDLRRQVRQLQARLDALENKANNDSPDG